MNTKAAFEGSATLLHFALPIKGGRGQGALIYHVSNTVIAVVDNAVRDHDLIIGSFSEQRSVDRGIVDFVVVIFITIERNLCLLLAGMFVDDRTNGHRSITAAAIEIVCHAWNLIVLNDVELRAM
jgi:hypothetical protein